MILKEIIVSVRLTRNFDSHMLQTTWEVKPDEKIDTASLMAGLESEIESYLAAKALQ